LGISHQQPLKPRRGEIENLSDGNTNSAIGFFRPFQGRMFVAANRSSQSSTQTGS